MDGTYIVDSNEEEDRMLRGEILDRYRNLRAISTRHHSAALDYLARPAILEQAKHLGLAYGRALFADSEEEMTLIFDLAIHTAKPGRSRAIDRYAKVAVLAPGSDEVHMLEAMREARFSVSSTRLPAGTLFVSTPPRVFPGGGIGR
jgi:hypothetical protein